MKRFVVFFVILLAIPPVLADWFYNSEHVTVNVDISSYVEVVPTTPDGYIESTTVNMTFFPRQTENQELLKFSTSPQAELSSRTLKFTWNNPEGRLDYKLNSNIKTTYAFTKINQKINFPIVRIPDSIQIYTKPSETIDSNDTDIINIANELVKGEDDLYSAVYKIADWTKNNVNYNLSTLTADISQKASWVLKYKEGVCDELTSLFAALLRSVGIPVRFVSGIAYTNSELFPENWGPHGWAEVYFPGYGWIPFDVTYGEYGWVDPTHIKFKDSVDSDEPSTYYQWLGRNADLSTNKLDIKAYLIDKSGDKQVQLNLEAFPLKNSVSFGSYNLLEATIDNPNDFYYSTEVYLNKPQEITILGDSFKSVSLLPGEKKKIFWILKIDDNLSTRYSYTFPLVINTLNSLNATTEITSNIREKSVSFDDVDKVAKLLEEEKKKKYSADIVVDCKIDKNEFYEYENIYIDCDAKNTGNIYLKNTEICFQDMCNNSDLGISQEKSFKFKVNTSNVGTGQSTVTLKNDIVSKVTYVNFKVDDIPKIQIEDIISPQNITYNQNFTVFFTVAKKSQSNPKNVNIAYSLNGISKKLVINEMDKDSVFALNFVGSQLQYGNNSYKISVNYYDALNKKYGVEREFSMNLVGITPFQRLVLALNRLGIISTEENIALVLLSGTIAFIVVVLLLFRRERKPPSA